MQTVFLDTICMKCQSLFSGEDIYIYWKEKETQGKFYS